MIDDEDEDEDEDDDDGVLVKIPVVFCVDWLDLQGQIQLESQILPNFGLFPAITCHWFKLDSPNWPDVHLSTVKIPIVFGADL